MKTVLVILVVVAVAARIDAKKRCFPIDDPICTKPFEVYDGTCGSPPCLFTCEALTGGPICEAPCRPGCRCKDGYARNEKGVCIPIKSCPKPVCSKPNEVYSETGNNPCEATCESPNRPLICKAAAKPGCGCKNGYLRDSKGFCVRPRDCDPKMTCENPNEAYGCGPIPGCEVTCDKSTFAPEDGCNAKICRFGCFCKPGYIRDAQGVCILPEDCPKPKCTKPFQVYSECGPPSCLFTCEALITGKICDVPCRPGCRCKDGYALNDKNVCIPIKSCPVVCKKPFEVYSDCEASPCLFTCEALTGGPICSTSCKRGCRCKDGYALNDNRECIPIKLCPKPVCTEPFEVYDEICGSPPCLFTCTALMLGPTCRAACRPGCRCKDGYAYNNSSSDRLCIPMKSCPNPCQKAFEEYKSCGTACPLTCEKPVGPLPCTKQCVKGCFCKTGYVRDNKGDCIHPNQCKV